jgi:hypothetical protein
VADERVDALKYLEYVLLTIHIHRRDIAKSSWVRWAEMMLERNINLLDTAGAKWRPRLKVK